MKPSGVSVSFLGNHPCDPWSESSNCERKRQLWPQIWSEEPPAVTEGCSNPGAPSRERLGRGYNRPMNLAQVDDGWDWWRAGRKREWDVPQHLTGHVWPVKVTWSISFPLAWHLIPGTHMSLLTSLLSLPKCPLLRMPVMTSSVQSLRRVWLFVAPWTAALQASLSFISSWSLLKLTSIESVMPSNHLILRHLHLFLTSIFPSIRVFSNVSALHVRWPKY